MKIIIVLILLFSSNLYAETITFKTQPIQNSKHPLQGNIPYIQGKGWEKINQTIRDTLLVNDGTAMFFDSEKLYQDQHYLSMHIHVDISGGRTYYREKYYVVDLKAKKIVTLDQMLKRYQLSAQHISKLIAEQINACVDDSIVNKPDICESADMEYFYRYYATDKNFINLKNANGFYLKKDILGISFDAGPFSVSFEYNLKTQKIQ